MTRRSLLIGGWLLGLCTGILGIRVIQAWRARGEVSDLERYEAVRAFAEQGFVGGTDRERLLDAALEGMLGSLDRYSRYYPPQEAAALERDTAGRYEGIGAMFRMVEGTRRILFTLPQSPAREAGLTVGDQVLEIDGEAATELEDEAFRRALAPPTPGPVHLTIESLDGSRRSLEIEARPLVDPSLRHVRILSEDPRIGWISIESFSKETVGEVVEAIEALEAEAPLSGLILDVRGNLGGVLDAAVGLVNLFVDDGLVVSTRGSSGTQETFAVEGRCRWPQLPLVLLVDETSASASEVVAGALQDHRRAAIVGTATYGKGVVQTIRRFDPWGARAKVTTAWYLSPAGRNFERDPSVKGGSGLAPDLEVSLPPDSRSALRRWLAEHQPSSAEEDALRQWEERSGLQLRTPAPEDPQRSAALALLVPPPPGTR